MNTYIKNGKTYKNIDGYEKKKECDCSHGSQCLAEKESKQTTPETMHSEKDVNQWKATCSICDNECVKGCMCICHGHKPEENAPIQATGVTDAPVGRINEETRQTGGIETCGVPIYHKNGEHAWNCVEFLPCPHHSVQNELVKKLEKLKTIKDRNPYTNTQNKKSRGWDMCARTLNAEIDDIIKSL